MDYTKMTKAELIKLVQELDKPMPDVIGLEKDLETAKKSIRIKDNKIVELQNKLENAELNLKTVKQEVRYELEGELKEERNLLLAQIDQARKHIELLKTEYDHLSQGMMEFDYIIRALSDKEHLSNNIIKDFIVLTRSRYLQEQPQEQQKTAEEIKEE